MLQCDLKKRALKFFFASGIVLGFFFNCSDVFADEVQLGHDLYQELCAACHGQEMMHPGLAFDLKKFPLTDPERFKHSVLNGKPPGMPAWNSQLNEEDVRLLWAYVKSGR